MAEGTGTLQGRVVLADLIVRFFNPAGAEQYATVQYLPRPDAWALRTNGTERNVAAISNTKAGAIALAGLGALLLAFIGVCLVFTLLYWNTKLIRSAAGPFLVVMLVGATLQTVTLFLPLLAAHPGPATCTVEKWLELLGFAACFGGLFLKTYRVRQVLDYRSRAKLTNNRLLLAGLLPLLAATVAYLALWTALAPPKATYHATHAHCSVGVFDWAATALKMGLLGVGVYLAIAVRNAPSAFNEAFYICLSTYWAFILLAVGTLLTLFLQAQPSVVLVGSGLQVFLELAVLLPLLWGPKMAVVAAGKQNHVRTTRLQTQASHGPSTAPTVAEESKGLGAKANKVLAAALGRKTPSTPSHTPPGGSMADSQTSLRRWMGSIRRSRHGSSHSPAVTEHMDDGCPPPSLPHAAPTAPPPAAVVGAETMYQTALEGSDDPQ